MAVDKIYKSAWFPVFAGAALLSIVNVLAVYGVPGSGTTLAENSERRTNLELVKSPEPLEFAAVPLHQSIQFSTSLQNRSDEPLEIRNIAASCGCADILPASRTIEPGSDVEITGTIKGRSHPGAISVRATISLRTQRTKRACQAEILVTADIVSILTVQPERITLVPRPSEGVAATDTLRITNTSKSPILVRLRTESPLDVELTPNECELQPAQSVNIELRCTSSATVASGTLTVLIDGEAEVHHVGIVIRPWSSVTLDPETLVLGVVTKAAEGIATSRAPSFMVRGLTEDTMVVPTSCPPILCKPVVTREGSDVTVSFGITPNFQPEQEIDPVKVLIVRKQGGSETISIPVVAFFGEGFKNETATRP